MFNMTCATVHLFRFSSNTSLANRKFCEPIMWSYLLLYISTNSSAHSKVNFFGGFRLWTRTLSRISARIRWGDDGIWISIMEIKMFNTACRGDGYGKLKWVAVQINIYFKRNQSKANNCKLKRFSLKPLTLG